MSSPEFPDYVAQNVATWTRANEEYTDARAAESWAQDEITWGIWRIPESQLGVLPDVERGQVQPDRPGPAQRPGQGAVGDLAAEVAA